MPLAFLPVLPRRLFPSMLVKRTALEYRHGVSIQKQGVGHMLAITSTRIPIASGTESRFSHHATVGFLSFRVLS